MKQRRIARKHLYAGGSCWPSNFGLVTSEPRLWSVFSWLSTMEYPGRLSVTRQGARFPKRRTFVPSRALKWQGCFWFVHYSWTWIFQTVLFTAACIVFTLYFYTKPRYEHGPVFRIWQQLADLPRSRGDEPDWDHLLKNFIRACSRFFVMGVPIFLGTHGD
jgi:hypothetical protein